MSFKNIQFDWLEVIIPAIDLLYSTPNDKDLIRRNANERTIVANIYSKANTFFTQKKEANQGLDDLVIDIEYNRNGEGSKEVFGKCDFCNNQDCFIKQRHLQYTTSSPDMIIHHRGFNDNNQVIIEFKKVSNKNSRERDDDKAKLIYFTCQQPFPNHEDENYQYHIGFFIDLDIDRYCVTTYQDATHDVPRCRQRGAWI
ncbi:MAG TPA: hypothetical protein DCG78_03415 [Anaerolineaceae bacterium]|nr:MAG: hypothetical protein XD89_0008 [Anaerolineae bacterium 49_20]HAE85543.1 hypothetical protein [Anaerolineaceae bacterium]